MVAPVMWPMDVAGSARTGSGFTIPRVQHGQTGLEQQYAESGVAGGQQAWYKNLGAWGDEVRLARDWFDEQFAKTMPKEVKFWSKGTKMAFLIIDLPALPQGAELAEAWNWEWDKLIQANHPELNKDGCGTLGGRRDTLDIIGSKKTSLTSSFWDVFTDFCPSALPGGGNTGASTTAWQIQKEKEKQEEEAAYAAKQKAKADAAALLKAQRECRPLALWDKWFWPSQSSVVRSVYDNRMKSLGLDYNSDALKIKLLAGGKVKALKGTPAGEKGKYLDLDGVFPPKWIIATSKKGQTSKVLNAALYAASYGLLGSIDMSDTHSYITYARPYKAPSLLAAVPLAYQDKANAALFADCPAVSGGGGGGGGVTEDTGGGMGIGLAILAAAYLWSQK